MKKNYEVPEIEFIHHCNEHTRKHTRYRRSW